MLDDKVTTALRVIELTVVVLLGVFVVYGTVSLFVSESPGTTKIAQIVCLLNDNWKPLLILLIPLFYLPARTLLANLEEGPWGLKMRKPEPGKSEETAEKNPKGGKQ